MQRIDIETQRIAFTPKTMMALIASVGIIVSSYFIAIERINSKIDETHKRIDNVSRILESQQNLIMSNRYKDSIEKAFIEFQLNELKIKK